MAIKKKPVEGARSRTARRPARTVSKGSKTVSAGSGKKKKGSKQLNPVAFTVALSNGRVVCAPSNGNRLVRREENRDISWRATANLQFELVFHRVDFDGAGRGPSDWPFSWPQAPDSGSSTGVVPYFEGTLRAERDLWTAYKYDVIVYEKGSKVASLDPMIIIGKR